MIRVLSPIDAYLAQLRPLLRGDLFLRRRVLAEVEAHLREAAADGGEEEAVRRFGPAAELARSLAPEAAARAALLPAGTALAAVGVLVVLFGLSENMLPPAPWPTADDAPASIRLPVVATQGAAAVAALAAIAALAYRRARLPLAGIAAASVVLAAVSGLMGAWSLYDEYGRLDVPGRPSALVLALGSAVLLAAAGAAVAALVWATAQRASRSYGLLR